MRLTRIFGVASLMVFVIAAAAAQEKVDNPEFANWSKHKKGTAVTLKVTTDFGGMNTESRFTTTLVDVQPDKVVLETTGVSTVNGMEIKAPSMKRDVPKEVILPASVKKEDYTAQKPPGTFEQGEETVKVAGGEFKAKWYKTKSSAAGNEVESKSWMSDDVPGRVVKLESATKGAAAIKTKMELVEVKKP